MAAAGVAVRVEAVSHRYGAKTVLAEASATFPSGSMTALVGPDGAGKSTLLSLIAGSRRLVSGEIHVLGADMRQAQARDGIASCIAFMPQGLGKSLYPTLSVVENIDFFGRLFAQSATQRRARIERVLAATGLAPFPNRPAGKLSGGMKQKLSLCCALVHEPDLLILDEPTTGVDPLSRRQFWALIDALRAERPDMTVIVATAYMEEAARFERLVAMDEGRILAADSTAAILTRSGSANLEQAFVALQRPERRGSAEPLVIPPRREDGGPPAIMAEELTQRFGDFVAVDHVSFRIERGEIFGFLGSNGCGKSTTMKMLTGLLPATSGRAELFGKPVDARHIETRRLIGYMSQSFSLYEELSVVENLRLHAKLYGLRRTEADPRITATLQRFDLSEVAEARPSDLPLGIRQRLQLATACLHQPEVLILDEPTSGVDPAARELFWRLIVDLSRQEGVTVFVTTHFMNEAELCDRISLMHAGRVLAVGMPAALAAKRGGGSLEEAFIAYLLAADGAPADPVTAVAPAKAVPPPGARPSPARSQLAASFGRILAFARRETIELLRDPVRLAFGLLGPLFLMITLGFGISFDVERIAFTVLDRDRSVESATLTQAFESSRYFRAAEPLGGDREAEARLSAGRLRLAIDIPPGFGRDLRQGRAPEVGIFIDGAETFVAETARGYASGVIDTFLRRLARQEGSPLPEPIIDVMPRFRYNQSLRSVVAIAPGVIMMLLAMIPAMMTALSVVREREIGSIINLSVSPASVGEFLLGKQIPYLFLGCVSAMMLVTLMVGQFGVPIQGSLSAFALGALLYVFAMTAFGLLISAFVRSQVAAIFASAIITTTIALNFSGYLYPLSALTDSGRMMANAFPAAWFQMISLGTVTKGLGFSSFTLPYLMLCAFGLLFLAAAGLLLRKQER
jgi:ribosome-dependent ATPase